MRHIESHVPDKYRKAIHAELRTIFYAESRVEAEQAAAAFIERHRRQYPSAVACLQRDWEACLTFYAYPKEHWITLRTSNIIERMFEEVKKRSKKMAAAFRNEGSCLLLFYAVIRSLEMRKLRMPS